MEHSMLPTVIGLLVVIAVAVTAISYLGLERGVAAGKSAGLYSNSE
jgi:hypothetical protein